MSPNLLTNLKGPKTEYRKSGVWLQYRSIGTSDAWTNLIPLSDIQGLPGVNAVANDTATGAYVDSLSSETRGALDRFVTDTRVARRADPMGLFYAAIAGRKLRPVVMVGAGSSTTAGYGISLDDERWLNRFALALQAAYPLIPGRSQPPTRTLAEAVAKPPSENGIQFVNAGINSATAANYLTATTLPQVAALSPSVILHMVGANDWAAGTTAADYKTTMLSKLTALDAATTGPVLHVLIQSFAPDLGLSRPVSWSDYAKALEEIAEERASNTIFVDVSPMFKLAGLPGDDYYGLMQGDDLHLNSSGQSLMADTIREFMGFAGSAAHPQPSFSVMPARFTSDSFATPSAVAGRSADLGLLGTARTWAQGSGAAGFEVASGTIRPTAASVIQFAGIAIGATSMRVSALVLTLPTAGNVYLDLYRAALDGTPDSYRLDFSVAGARLQKRVAGVTTLMYMPLKPSELINSVVSMQWYRGFLSLLVDGVERYSTDDTTVASGGYIGFARTSTAVGGSFNRFAIDLLA